MKSVKTIVAFLTFALAFVALAERVERADAIRAARGWANTGTTMGRRISSRVSTADEYAVTNGYSFYALKMASGGTLFMSSDTDFEPVIGFTENDNPDLSEKSPLRALLEKDIVARSGLAKGTSAGISPFAAQSAAIGSRANRKWDRLMNGSAFKATTGAGGSEDPEEDIDDVRVAPLLETVWSQTADDNGKPLYNYYTPKQYPCGCTATAASQIMRYFKYPTEEMPPTNYLCSVDGLQTNCTTIAGTYDWSLMPADPNATNTDEEREMIGRLCYDVAVALKTEWSKLSGGSALPTELAEMFMGKSFGYANAYVFSDMGMDTTKPTYGGGLHRLDIREKTIYANLDAKRPVELGIYGYPVRNLLNPLYWSGHAVVADGYGYKTIDGEEIAFVHINMGWGGTDNLWYNIPEINSANSGAHVGDLGYDFLFLGAVCFNISPDDTGVLLTGRLTDEDGFAMSNATVTAYVDGDEVASVISDESGIYAFSIEGGKTYDLVSVSEDGSLKGELSGVKLDRMGMVIDGKLASASGIGNRWGNDMTLMRPTVEIGSETYTSLSRALECAKAGDTVKIVLPTKLPRSVEVAVDCKIVATNENAALSPITPVGGAVIAIADGAKIAVSNVVFAVGDYDVTIDVSAGGRLKVSGVSDLGCVNTVGYTNLVVSALAYPFAVNCAGAQKRGEYFAIAEDAYPVATDYAYLIVHASNTRLGGEAVMTGELVLRWATGVKVPFEKTVAQVDDGQGPVRYRSIDDIIEDFGGVDADREIIVRKSAEVTRYVATGKRLVFRGAEDVDDTPVVVPDSTAGFEITDGGSLTISNLTFNGFIDEDYTDLKGFIEVNGGSLTLDDGAELSDIEGHVSGGSGAINLIAGEVTMLPGSRIVRCMALEGDEYGGMGGAIYVDSQMDDEGKPLCCLNLLGGEISDCGASTENGGGGVYVYCSKTDYAEVLIAGAQVIDGNVSKITDEGYLQDNLCLEIANEQVCEHVMVTNPCTGSIGFNYASVADDSVVGNCKGQRFAVRAAAGIDPTVFFNDIDDNLIGEVDDGGWLVWTQDPYDPDVCPEWDADNATAKILWPDGTSNFWYRVQAALDSATNLSEVVVLKDDVLDGEGATIHGKVTVRTVESEEFGLQLDCGEDFTISVPAGSELSVTNLNFSGTSLSSKSFIDVDGGKLMLVDTGIYNITGYGSRDANAVTVSHDGVLTMDGYADISDCYNLYVDESVVEADGDIDIQGSAGGGILLEGSTAYLNDCYVTRCAAVHGGGIMACNGSKLYLSGHAVIADNENHTEVTPDVYESCNLEVSDNSRVILAGELTGIVYETPGYLADVNFAAYVDEGWDWTDVALTNSAAGFLHDRTGEEAVACTNAAGEAAIVWCGALSGKVCTNAAGVVYWPLFPEAVPVPPAPKPEDKLPELSPSASVVDVSEALDDAGFVDESVSPFILGADDPAAVYADFRNWAIGVEGGIEAVLASDKALVSYRFGTDELLENDPTVTISEVVSVDGGLTVSVTVKDGDDPVEVASASVVKLFEATSDLSDWVGGKLELTFDDLTDGKGETVSITVKPVETTKSAFIRLAY